MWKLRANSDYSALRNLRILALLCFLIALGASSQAHEGDTKIMTVQDFTDAPELQRRISTSVAAISVEDVLIKITADVGVSLTAERSIGNQRVSLIVVDCPLQTVMQNLTNLLSHKPLSPHGYYWQRSMTKAGSLTYRLFRTARSRTEEALALDFPHRKSVAWLHDMRHLLSVSPDKWSANPSDMPREYLTDEDFSVYRSVVKSLTDEQIDRMVQNGAINIPPLGLEEHISQYNRMWKTAQEHARAVVKKAGGRDIYPNGVPDAPPNPPGVLFSADDDNGNVPTRIAIFSLNLSGINTLNRVLPPGQTGGMAILFDPLKLQDTDIPQRDTPDDTAKVDLTPTLQEWKSAEKQREEFSYLLKALGYTARINIYQEHFLHPIAFDKFHKTPLPIRGTVRSLLDAWCARFGYTWERKENTYHLWSKAWAFDRQADVPETTLNLWRKRRGTKQVLSGENLIRLAQSLSWQQLAINMKPEFPEVENWTLAYFSKVRDQAQL